MELVIIDSAAPGDHNSLDRKEAYWMHQLKTLNFMGFGGLNTRNDLLRADRASCACRYCKKDRTPGV